MPENRLACLMIRILCSCWRFAKDCLISLLFTAAGLSIYLCSSVDYEYTVYGQDKAAASSLQLALNEDLYKKMAEDYASLKQMNKDVCAWINIPEVAYYPVMYSGDNEKYLHLDADGQSYRFAGCLFADESTEGLFDDASLIYGHHMLDGSMFAGLRKFQNEAFFQKSSVITVYDGQYFYIYKPFTVFVAPGDSFMLQTRGFLNEKQREEYFRGMAEKSICSMEPSLEPDYSRQMLFLYTCEYGYSFENPRGIVGASCIRTLRYQDKKLEITQVEVPFLRGQKEKEQES